MTPQISIIIPAYNSGALLSPCVKSILGQSFKDFELIIVDDGSTDGTADLCKEFEQFDPRIRYIHKENGGVIQALKLGISNACGEWIAFCDHDDSLPPDAFEVLHQWTNTETDLIVGFSFPGDGVCHTLPIRKWRERIVASDPILCTRWARLYRHTIMDADSADAPSSIKMGEDMIMNIKAALKTEKDVTIINRKVYNYYRNQNSFSVHFKWTASWCSSVYSLINDILLKNGQKRDLALPLIRNGVGMMKKLIITGARQEQKKLSDSGLVRMIVSDIAESGYVPSREEKKMLSHPTSILVRIHLQARRVLEIGIKVLKRYL